MKEYDKLRSEYGKLEIIWGHSGDNSNYDSIDYIPQESWLRNLVKIHHHTVMITTYLDGIRELSKKRQGRTNARTSGKPICHWWEESEACAKTKPEKNLRGKAW